MNVNLDGLRNQLTHSFNELSADLDDAISNGEVESFRQDDLIEKLNNVGQMVGVLNCVFDNDNDGFNDLSEKLTVSLIEA